MAQYIPNAFLRKESKTIAFLMGIVFLSLPVSAQQHNHSGNDADKPLPKEEDYYSIIDVPMPKYILPEVGGLKMMPDERLAMVTRHGEVWLIKDPSGNKPIFSKYASGLNEALGLNRKGNDLFVVQRTELSKLSDKNGDGKADYIEKIIGIPTTGNYHEYNYGPVIDKEGNFYINLNLAHDNGEAGYGNMVNKTDWRGWMIKVSPDGVMSPFASGMRSPGGIGKNEKDELFYTENQGEWVGTGHISHVKEGNFFGHPSSLKSSGLPGSNIKLTVNDLPKNAPLLHEAIKLVPGLKMPSVRIPHGILGISTSGFIVDQAGSFGPFFKDQFFVGDQGHAKIVRVSMEKVNGEYQGAVYPFRQGFASGILRMEWGNDGSLFVGMSDRGWKSTGQRREGLQRLVWNNKTPFEIEQIQAKSDGFDIQFTLPVDPASLMDTSNYKISGFDYNYHVNYGSDIKDKKGVTIKAIQVGKDFKSVRLVLDGLRAGYIHELKLEGIRSQGQQHPLLHNVAYYSLNAIPTGGELSLSTPGVVTISEPISTPDNQSKTDKKTDTKTTSQKNKEKVIASPIEKRLNKMPESWGKPDRVITIGTKPGLKFDIESFNVKPGEKVKLVFKNVDDMQHNLLIVNPTFADEVGKKAMDLGIEGSKMNYVPKDKNVLFHTGLLAPNSEEAIYFTVPEKEGKYEYICTYPGHYFVMRGLMNVKR